MLVLIFCFGHHFFKHVFYMADLVVVSVSIIVDLFLKSELEAVGFIAIFRLWRIVRIVHGFVVASEQVLFKPLNLPC